MTKFKILDISYKSNEIDEIEYKVARLEEAQKDYTKLWSTIYSMQKNIAKLQEPQSIGKFIKSWIKKWLGV